jgi:hypothetical protein
MQELARDSGQADQLTPSHQVDVAVWSSQVSGWARRFGVDAGQLSDDRYMVFFNQLSPRAIALTLVVRTFASTRPPPGVIDKLVLRDHRQRTDHEAGDGRAVAVVVAVPRSAPTSGGLRAGEGGDGRRAAARTDLAAPLLVGREFNGGLCPFRALRRRGGGTLRRPALPAPRPAPPAPARAASSRRRS